MSGMFVTAVVVAAVAPVCVDKHGCSAKHGPVRSGSQSPPGRGHRGWPYSISFMTHHLPGGKIG